MKSLETRELSALIRPAIEAESRKFLRKPYTGKAREILFGIICKRRELDAHSETVMEIFNDVFP